MTKAFTISLQIFFLTAIISVSSCKKEEDPTPQNETFSYTESIHQACANDFFSGSAFEVPFENDITTTTVQQAFASQGRTYDASKIVSAKLMSLKATASTGTVDLGDIAYIRVYLRLSGASSDIQIAHTETIALDATSVTLTIDNAELKAFITQLSVLTVKVGVKGTAWSNNCIDFSQGVVQVEVKP